jgi:aldehyde dehydrogenase (NAD+)
MAGKQLPLESQLFINGSFVDASDRRTFELRSPYSGDLVGQIAEATTQDVDTAVEAAQAAQPAWAALTPQERGRPLAKLAQMIADATPELARLDALSLGRPVSTYFDGHYAVTHFKYFSEAAYPVGTSSLNTPGFMNVSLRQAYGVGAAIIPWNAPLVFLSKKLAPALAAGNCMVLKTSEKAPFSSHRVAEMLNEAGFPPGVVNILHGHGLPSGDAIARHMGIRALSFTGSVRTGRAIQKAAAESNFKHLVFELGGKSPAIVFSDADLDRAAQETQNSIMFHSGQTCMANSRIYVHKDVAENFVQKFTACAKARKLGDPLEQETTSGPQADKTQYDTVMKYIEEGKKDVRVLETSTPMPTENGELFIQPTVFLDVPSENKLSKEEVFGPVVLINTFDTEKEALQIANDTEYGLYAAVYTQDIDRALRVAKGLESGMVGVNCTSPTAAWDMPFGGYKQSGIGRESLLQSLDDWLETKSVFIRVGGETKAADNGVLGR